MYSLEESSFKPLLHSKNDLHLTAYLKNSTDPAEVKKQIYNVIATAHQLLHKVLPEEELDRFISPLRHLLKDNGFLSRFKGNIGLFRTRDHFRIVHIPVDVDYLCVIATSYHIKPLLRGIQSVDSNELARNILEFQQAERVRLGKRNLFQIAKAAVQGRIKKLIVTDGIQIFGKIDPRTGGISIHPVHSDHEDDDLLDDLAQMVLARGGEVVVAPKDSIPKNSPILAILKTPLRRSKRIKTYDYFENQKTPA